MNQSINCLSTKEKGVWAKQAKNPKTFIDYSEIIDDAYENLEDYNPANKRKVLIVLDDMTANMVPNKKSSTIVIELFLRTQHLNCIYITILL